MLNEKPPVHGEQHKHIKPPTKIERVTDHLAAGNSLNRFQAERLVNDHCLHSTISALRYHGLEIETTPESVPGWAGIPTRVIRYSLNEENQAKARVLVAHMRRRRGITTGGHTQC